MGFLTLNRAELSELKSHISTTDRSYQSYLNMGSKAAHQPIVAMNSIDEEAAEDSNSSDNETDTNSDSKLNDAPDTNYSDANTEVLQAFQQADRGVLRWRIIVNVIMVCMASVLTVLTYVQLSETERKDFEASFNLQSETILSRSAFEWNSLANSLGSLSDSITLNGLQRGQDEWPYVALSGFEFDTHAVHVPPVSRDSFVCITPIVQEVDKWNIFNTALLRANNKPFNPYLFTYDEGGKQIANGTGPFLPVHHVYTKATVHSSTDETINVNNYDASSDPDFAEAATVVNKLQRPAITGLLSLQYFRDSYPDMFHPSEPLSMLIFPIFRALEGQTKEIVGYAQSLVEWKYFFSLVDSHASGNFVCVVENTCGDQFAFLLSKQSAEYIRYENAFDNAFADIKATSVIGSYESPNGGMENATEAGVCIYTLSIYPTIDFRNQFNANAIPYAVVIACTMFLMVGAFFSYDTFVRRRNDKVVQTAVRSTAIVTSMFPSNVRDRLYKDVEEKEKMRKQHGNLKTYLRDNDGSNIISTNAPLADLFAETTVLFADIAGFTAWSSVREPTQVFILLETLYAAFDAIAKRRRIFKVETIGDCYVAVSGLPDPRADHALIMSKFANDIMNAMRTISRDLEISLGPDTGDLALRIGIHSGPVTAGVLRGERARFQLFGDTMNTAARMEQTGIKNRIQVSQATADCLVAEGKSYWLRLRDDKIIAKGKGEMITYWLDMKSATTGSKSSCSSGDDDDSEIADADFADLDKKFTADNETKWPIPHVNRSRKEKKLHEDKIDRLIDWNTESLLKLLQQILSRRTDSIEDKVSIDTTTKQMPFDEVTEIIVLPQVNKSKYATDVSLIQVSDKVSTQLRDFVSKIAYMYNDNHFHNFEHASHVAMSVTKLLSRIVAPSDVLDDYRDRVNKDLSSTLHDHTYGITSDPLTQFACVFSALIHDVDHPGVPNTQLVNENSDLASRYQCKSVAEQNSIDLAWELLMKEEYNELRCAICATSSEFVRFRQLVVNAVMATDIMDKELKNIRNMRWTKAFKCESAEEVDVNFSQDELMDQVNRKATIVIEHMIQASDVSHTMQHWHIYRKWNELFYYECYDAYAQGRCAVDPTETWYQGELDFYDYYIIPLAKKLKECGVFGVSSTEYLQYAINNRSEWQARGKEIVTGMKSRIVTTTQLQKSNIENKLYV